ncbi:hypothetical protein VIC_004574 [Vibrio coralliilyticus ATCC BAA-450]|nr:hypothetical protein VIC_004574 [Vibrio coralliilyticus ATCC BAA-450]
MMQLHTTGMQLLLFNFMFACFYWGMFCANFVRSVTIESGYEEQL